MQALVSHNICGKMKLDYVWNEYVVWLNGKIIIQNTHSSCFIVPFDFRQANIEKATCTIKRPLQSFQTFSASAPLTDWRKTSANTLKMHPMYSTGVLLALTSFLIVCCPGSLFKNRIFEDIEVLCDPFKIGAITNPGWVLLDGDDGVAITTCKLIVQEQYIISFLLL